ncbi:DUF2237 family protein [Saccharospirillum alexandrii]|uniref:DUF2237 family protein n=1 Tax=Saccharospirillum alexandrii TaxID=2448477 RepID=UPI001C704313|nr:DUF2237 family protein [Saccharospirillum alexandrii]
MAFQGGCLNSADDRIGLKPGDQWCLCASRFLQAHDEGCAPMVNLEATHRSALSIVPLEVLKANAPQ